MTPNDKKNNRSAVALDSILRRSVTLEKGPTKGRSKNDKRPRDAVKRNLKKGWE